MHDMFSWEHYGNILMTFFSTMFYVICIRNILLCGLVYHNTSAAELCTSLVVVPTEDGPLSWHV